MDFEALRKNAHFDPDQEATYRVLEERKLVTEHAVEAKAMAQESIAQHANFAKDLVNGEPMSPLVLIDTTEDGKELYVYAVAAENGNATEVPPENYSYVACVGIAVPKSVETYLEAQGGDVLRLAYLGTSLSGESVYGREVARDAFIEAVSGYDEDFENIEAVETRKTESIDQADALFQVARKVMGAIGDQERNQTPPGQWFETMLRKYQHITTRTS